MPTLIPQETLEIPTGDRFHYVYEYTEALLAYNSLALKLMERVANASAELNDEQEYIFTHIRNYLHSIRKAKESGHPAEKDFALGVALGEITKLNPPHGETVEIMKLIVELGDAFDAVSDAGTEAWNLSSSVQDWEALDVPEGFYSTNDESVVKYLKLRDEAHNKRPVILFRILGKAARSNGIKKYVARLLKEYFEAVDSKNAWRCFYTREHLYHAATRYIASEDALWDLKNLLDSYEATALKMGKAQKAMEDKGIHLAKVVE